LYAGGQITLLVDKIFSGCPSWFLQLPIFRTYLLGEVLYHEIGHHIHHTKQPERRDKETVAEEWKEKLLRSFMSKRYWYLAALAKPYHLLISPAMMWVKRRGREASAEST
jgi:hypothetical protein